MCNNCYELCHSSCLNKQYSVKNNSLTQTWTCNHCLHSVLPFYTVPTASFNESPLSIPKINPDVDGTNPHIEVLNANSNHTSIAHLNSQCLSSTFDEFSVFMETYQMDIVSLSETWLKDNNQLIKYVSIP